MIEINPRLIAAQALVEITKDNAYNNMALKKILRQNGAMPPFDRAFVTEMVNGALRNLFYIDYLLNAVSTVKTERMKPFILSVLRLGVYQLEFMSVPQSAAINEAVEMVKEKGFGKLSGFVNGVLRNVVRQRDSIFLPDKETKPAEYLSVRFSHPLWLVKMWLHSYDFDFVKGLCEKNNMPPDITICCNKLKTEPSKLKKDLEEKGIRVAPPFFMEEALHITKTSDLSRLEEFQRGLFHVQDESSLLAVKVLDPKKGERILDMCASPGGKSLFAAELMKDEGEIISRDIYEHKIDLIEENTQRLDLHCIHAELFDALVLDEKNLGAFDRVIVDAPCSGFGIVRKKPDIKLNRTGEDIDSLVKLQRKILERAGQYVREGGILLYSTCTICKKENEKNVEWFLQNNSFEMCSLEEYLPDKLRGQFSDNGMLQLFPQVHNTDGFFIACMKRKGR